MSKEFHLIKQMPAWEGIYFPLLQGKKKRWACKQSFKFPWWSLQKLKLLNFLEYAILLNLFLKRAVSHLGPKLHMLENASNYKNLPLWLLYGSSYLLPPCASSVQGTVIPTAPLSRLAARCCIPQRLKGRGL